jgi:hypothetical protein
MQAQCRGVMSLLVFDFLTIDTFNIFADSIDFPSTSKCKLLKPQLGYFTKSLIISEAIALFPALTASWN